MMRTVLCPAGAMEVALAGVLLALSVRTAGAQSTCVPVHEGALSWWPSDSMAEDVLSGRNGVMHGTVRLGEGVAGSGFVFERPAGFLEILDADFGLEAGKSLTIEAWIRLDGDAARQVLVHKPQANRRWDSFLLEVVDGRLRFSLSSELSAAHPTATTRDRIGRDWTHVAAVWNPEVGDASDFRIYLDGRRAPTTFEPDDYASQSGFRSAYSFALHEVRGSAYVGARVLDDRVVDPFEGMIDELTVYDRALSDDLVAAVARARGLGKCRDVSWVIAAPPPAVLGSSYSHRVQARLGRPAYSFNVVSGMLPPGLTLSAAGEITGVSSRRGAYRANLEVTDAGGHHAMRSVSFLVITPPEVLPGLVGWWRGDGDVADAVFANNGTMVGDARFEDGLIGKAFALGGADGSVTLPLDVSRFSEVTVSAWFRAEPGSSCFGITSYLQGARGLYLCWDGQAGGRPGGTGMVNTSCPRVQPGSWVHAAATFGSGRLRSYQNGIECPSAPGLYRNENLGMWRSGSRLRLGGADIGTNTLELYSGLIDEVRVYDRALSAAEIRASYDGSPAPLLDSDDDGLSDRDDVCPTVADPTQSDLDGDGIGDACDPETEISGRGRRDFVPCPGRLSPFEIDLAESAGAVLSARTSPASCRVDLFVRWGHVVASSDEIVIEGVRATDLELEVSSAPPSITVTCRVGACKVSSSGHAVRIGLEGGSSLSVTKVDADLYIGCRSGRCAAVLDRKHHARLSGPDAFRVGGGMLATTGEGAVSWYPDFDPARPDDGEFIRIPSGYRIDYANARFGMVMRPDSLAVGAVSSAIGGFASDGGSECVPPPSGLLAWLPGNHIRDIVGRVSADASEVGHAPGRVGEGFFFRGSSGPYLALRESAAIHLRALSVEAWIRAGPDVLGWKPITMKESDNPIRRNWYLGLCRVETPFCNPGQLFFSSSTDGVRWYVAGGKPLNDDTLHHVAATSDGAGSVRLYVDGVRVETSFSGQKEGLGGPGAPDLVDQPIYVGGGGVQASDPSFSGMIDEVSLYDRVLLDTEVRSIRDAGSAGKCSAPFDQWFLGTMLFSTLYALGFLVLGLGIYALRGWQARRREQELTDLVETRTRQISAEKDRAEAALADAERARSVIAQQAERLRELDGAKSRFFANLSHEFRTPLTLIRGPIERVLEAPAVQGDARLSELMMTAHHEAGALLHLVNQLLELSQLDAGKLRLRVRRGDVGAFVRDVVDAFIPLAELRGEELLFHAPDSPADAWFDPVRMEHVVNNLIANALKFTGERGKVSVAVVAGDAARIGIVVRDTGPGIPASEIEHVFDRFYQVDSSPSRAHEGAGLGLALAREIVDLHGGEITVESGPGFGSVFTVWLRRDGAQFPQEVLFDEDGGTRESHSDRFMGDREVPANGESYGDGRLPAVLVVEDNASMRSYLADSLAEAYRITTAANGAEALAKIRTARPDLVLSDVMMPGMDGFELCRQIRLDAALRDLPVILLTAKATEDGEIEGIDLGADDYVTKPFSLPVLKARIGNQVRRHRLLAGLGRPAAAIRPRPVSFTSEDESFLERVRDAMENGIAGPGFNIDSLADRVGVSRRHLQRRLNEAAGIGPQVLLRSFRLHRAAAMLKAQTGSVSEIAFAVGFRNADHFSRRFKDEFGVTPSGYMESG